MSNADIAGDFHPASPTFNSLYTIDLGTGSPSRIGSLGIGETLASFIMSFSFDTNGTMYGASMMSLYTIDRQTGAIASQDCCKSGGVTLRLKPC